MSENFLMLKSAILLSAAGTAGITGRGALVGLGLIGLSRGSGRIQCDRLSDISGLHVGFTGSDESGLGLNSKWRISSGMTSISPVSTVNITITPIVRARPILHIK